VYPNPVGEQLQLNYCLSVPSRVQVSIFDEMGRVLAAPLNENREGGSQNLLISTKQYGLMPGLYFVHVLIGDQLFIRKIVKQ
jgi:hypothetical protein